MAITALNGRMPSSRLTVADTGALGSQRLRGDAAAAWHQMLMAGMPAGYLRSGYRTLTQQGAQDPKLAAPVGKSQHGEGLAADTDEPARSWIAKHGAAHGWRIGMVKGEPWHAEFTPSSLPLILPETTPLKKGNDMRLVATPSGRRFSLGELTWQDHSNTWEQASHSAHIWNSDTNGEPQVITDADLDLEVGQIQQRRAQLAGAFKDLGL